MLKPCAFVITLSAITRIKMLVYPVKVKMLENMLSHWQSIHKNSARNVL